MYRLWSKTNVRLDFDGCKRKWSHPRLQWWLLQSNQSSPACKNRNLDFDFEKQSTPMAARAKRRAPGMEGWCIQLICIVCPSGAEY
ncbi:hypothetical protein PISMIDRAFT_671673 [Pisolithus microcarpus 441]|uniref:Uncharacterized protein n=1 Tax=Pisolithus microcarpus 441 TaxID=765257 RepID=A0A0C9ZK79_9AGAM|nr:hypothetical protein BKA83DRAFT_671673 [Pisolithus microcarpus]KIK29731.1 hypothetical protein PISMIDRAFT_671673 [Pisolithus microcarpus 441]